MKERVLEKIAARQRITAGEALEAASDHSVGWVHRLGRAALECKRKLYGERATYTVNLTVNPSNVCSGGCQFCHYHVTKGDKNAYVLTAREILDQLARSDPSEIHITGGLNEDWNFENALALIGRIRTLHPSLHIKAYTAVEIHHFAATEKKGLAEVLGRFKDAGLDSLTGGGAEIFAGRLRAKYCPDKIGPAEWLDVHFQAHAAGLSSNATMLYGLGETDGEIVEHLLALREAQDRSGGFSCFIPLAYQPGKGNPAERGPSALENLRIIALSRGILDNFAHIKAYWPMIGVDTAAVGLSFGADDLDGTLGKERIAHSGETKSPEFLSRELMEQTIRAAGFEPVERDGRFAAVPGTGS